MAIEESASSGLAPEASTIPDAEDPKDHESTASLKENTEVSDVTEERTLHKEREEVPEQYVDVVEVVAEVRINNEAEGEITEVEAEVRVNNEAEGEITEVEAEAAGLKDNAESESQPHGSEAKEAGTGDQTEITDEAGAGAELYSQADGDVSAPADSESETTDAATAETDGDQEDETPRKLTVDDIKTAPMDFRFPTTNQAKHCFTRYVEYHKCVQAKGDDDPDCNKYARYYRSLCPGEWVDKWNEERENGTFAGPL